MILPPPSLPWIFWIPLCDRQKGSSTNFFGTVRQQFFETKSWYSPLRHKVFRYPKHSETQKGSSTKIFGSVRQKNSTKLWYSYYQKKFDTITFLKYKGPPRIFFGTVRHKIFDGKTWYPTPLLSIKILYTKKFLKQTGSLTKFLGPVRQKKLRQKIVT